MTQTNTRTNKTDTYRNINLTALSLCCLLLPTVMTHDRIEQSRRIENEPAQKSCSRTGLTSRVCYWEKMSGFFFFRILPCGVVFICLPSATSSSWSFRSNTTTRLENYHDCKSSQSACRKQTKSATVVLIFTGLLLIIAATSTAINSFSCFTWHILL